MIAVATTDVLVAAIAASLTGVTRRRRPAPPRFTRWMTWLSLDRPREAAALGPRSVQYRNLARRR